MTKFSDAERSRLLYLLLVKEKSIAEISKEMGYSETEINVAIGRMKAQVTKKEKKNKEDNKSD